MRKLIQKIETGDEFDGFAVFVVGGAVRDHLRGMDVEDIDIMTVPIPGKIENPVEVLTDRMTRIDTEDAFPVFKDSHGREVALPRTEESTGRGFHDFDVSLVEPGTPVRSAVQIDLERRDLTINAIAVALTDVPKADIGVGDIIDPFDGRDDLEASRIDPVSDAFATDALRGIRLARFAARLEGDVTDAGRELTRQVVPDLTAIPDERITIELRKVFKQADRPSIMFDILDEVDALDIAFPGLADVNDFSLLDEVDNPKDRFGVLGIIGDSQQIVEQQKLTTDESKLVLTTDRFSRRVANIGKMDKSNQVELVDLLNANSSIGVKTPVRVAAARFNIDPEQVMEQIEAVQQAIESVSADDVMQSMDIDRSDIGNVIDGQEFGQKLTEQRARKLQ